MAFSSAFSSHSTTPGIVSGVGPGWAGCVACGDVVPSVSAASGLCSCCSASFRSPRSVVWSAFRSGGLWSAVLRPSSHAPSGWVSVLVFRSPASAATFARVFSAILGIPLTVRSRIAVSVPVLAYNSRVARTVSAVGGLVPFARSVRSSGWAR